MRVLSCFMRTAHNIAFNSEDDSALLTRLKTQKIFVKNVDGRIKLYNGLKSQIRASHRDDDTPNTNLTLCCKAYVTKYVAFERLVKRVSVILHCNRRAATVPVHIIV